jgi:hypothetical protein
MLEANPNETSLQLALMISSSLYTYSVFLTTVRETTAKLDMSMLSMSMMGGMAAGLPSLLYAQQIFWAFVGTAIGVAALANILNKVVYHRRITSQVGGPTIAPHSSDTHGFLCEGVSGVRLHRH